MSKKEKEKRKKINKKIKNKPKQKKVIKNMVVGLTVLDLNNCYKVTGIKTLVWNKNTQAD